MNLLMRLIYVCLLSVGTDLRFKVVLLSLNCGFFSMISRMLVKDPSKRTTLEDIVSHPWMESGSPMSLPQVPLVCREALQEEDQAYIMQKIVDGNIATKQEILEYVHVSVLLSAWKLASVSFLQKCIVVKLSIAPV